MSPVRLYKSPWVPCTKTEDTTFPKPTFSLYICHMREELDSLIARILDSYFTFYIQFVTTSWWFNFFNILQSYPSHHFLTSGHDIYNFQMPLLYPNSPVSTYLLQYGIHRPIQFHILTLAASHGLCFSFSVFGPHLDMFWSYFFLILHLGITPGNSLGTIWGAKDWTQVVCKASVLHNAPSLRIHM